jgi:hypothetical protein
MFAEKELAILSGSPKVNSRDAAPISSFVETRDEIPETNGR